LRPLVEQQHRKLVGLPPEEADSFFRSDHLNFARAGVPVLYMHGGSRNTADRLDAAWSAFGKRYHKPADKYDPNWDMRGVAQDLQVAYAVGKELASGHEWPVWARGTEFRAVRQASRTHVDATHPDSGSQTTQADRSIQ